MDREARSKMRESVPRRIFLVINTIFLLLVALVCIAPFVNLLAISFSDKVAVAAGGHVLAKGTHACRV